MEPNQNPRKNQQQNSLQIQGASHSDIILEKIQNPSIEEEHIFSFEQIPAESDRLKKHCQRRIELQIKYNENKKWKPSKSCNVCIKSLSKMREHF